MSEETQIEELAKFCCYPCEMGYSGGCVEGVNPCKCGIAIETAKRLYEAGYRKQVEGEWIEHEDDWCGSYYTCSVCKCDWTTIDGTPQENNMRYCPECGAKMREGE